MDNILELHQRLEYYKKTNPFVPGFDEPGRHTYCHLMVLHEGKYHKFEVRGWHTTMDYRFTELSCVNWTLAAGTCTISIKDDNIAKFKILEDEPTLQVLYG